MKHTPAIAAAALFAAFAGRLSAAETTAHDPQYGDRSVWPAWVEQTAFVKEQWPPARLLVWAHAGQTTRGTDLSDPANWLEDGKPAATPPDEDTDIVFPSADKRYHVAGDIGCSARHVTFQSGVTGFMASIIVHGNVWVKSGASFQAIQPRGTRHTFMRNDDPKPNQAANKIAFNKPEGQSTEWIGAWRLGDELDLFSGTFVVAPDSTFLAGDRSTQHIYPKGRLVLHSGALFQKRGNQYWGHDLEIVGAFSAGTPERPLTRDCTLGLSFKAKGEFRLSKPGDRGLILYPEGRMAVHSADPAKARLVVRRNPLPAQSHGFPNGEESPEVAAMPHGIDLLLLGEARLDGVEFNDILAGGIALRDPGARTAWKHVAFGTGNFGPPESLFVPYAGSLDLTMKDTGIAAGLAKEAAGTASDKRARKPRGAQAATSKNPADE